MPLRMGMRVWLRGVSGQCFRGKRWEPSRPVAISIERAGAV